MATKRKPTPAQIAARERFAEMARSGAFKRKASKSRSVSKKVDLEAWMDEYERLENENMHSENVVRLADLLGTKNDQQVTRQIVKNIQRVGYLTNDDYDRQRAIYKRLWPKVEHLYKAKRNPAKKTVSQKISQLSREGYPQKQAVAIALSEERAGKVRRNPISDIANIIYNQLGANRFAMMTGAKNFVAGDNFLMFSIGKNQSVYNKVRITLTPDDLYDLEFFKMNRLGDISKTQKFEGVYAEQLQDLFTQVTGLYTSMGTMGRRSNPRASNPIVLVTDRKPSKRKANPVKRVALPYVVEAKRDIGGETVNMGAIAAFPGRAQADDYAKALQSRHKGLKLTVKAK